MPEAVGWRWAVVVFMSVFLMSSSWDLEIALSGASAKVKPPNRLFGPGRKCVETSDDVIEDDFTSTLDSRIWDFSPMRLGAAKTARESAKSPDEKDLRSGFRFLAIRASKNSLASPRRKWRTNNATQSDSPKEFNRSKQN